MQPASEPASDKKYLKPALLICGSIILILVIVLVAVLVKKKVASSSISEETSSESSESSEPPEDPGVEGDTGDSEELYSIEEIVSQQSAIFDNPASSFEDAFSARVRLASYYLSFEQPNDAKTVMDAVDQNSLDTMQTMRYGNIMYEIHTALGDDEARGRYYAMYINARNKLQEEQAQ